MYQYVLRVLYVLYVLYVYEHICTYCMYCMYCMHMYVSACIACIGCIAFNACICMYWDLHMFTYIHIHTIHAHTDICILGYTYTLYVCVHIKFSNTCNITWHIQYIHICTGRFTDDILQPLGQKCTWCHLKLRCKLSARKVCHETWLHTKHTHRIWYYSIEPWWYNSTNMMNHSFMRPMLGVWKTIAQSAWFPKINTLSIM